MYIYFYRLIYQLVFQLEMFLYSFSLTLAFILSPIYSYNISNSKTHMIVFSTFTLPSGYNKNVDILLALLCYL